MEKSVPQTRPSTLYHASAEELVDLETKSQLPELCAAIEQEGWDRLLLKDKYKALRNLSVTRESLALRTRAQVNGMDKYRKTGPFRCALCWKMGASAKARVNSHAIPHMVLERLHLTKAHSLSWIDGLAPSSGSAANQYFAQLMCAACEKRLSAWEQAASRLMDAAEHHDDSTPWSPLWSIHPGVLKMNYPEAFARKTPLRHFGLSVLWRVLLVSDWWNRIDNDHHDACAALLEDMRTILNQPTTSTLELPFYAGLRSVTTCEQFSEAFARCANVGCSESGIPVVEVRTDAADYSPLAIALSGVYEQMAYGVVLTNTEVAVWFRGWRFMMPFAFGDGQPSCFAPVKVDSGNSAGAVTTLLENRTPIPTDELQWLMSRTCHKPPESKFVRVSLPCDNVSSTYHADAEPIVWLPLSAEPVPCRVRVPPLHGQVVVAWTKLCTHHVR